MDKAVILKAIQNQLAEKLEATLAEALAAKEAATNEESKAENKYDTRGLEASYIAGAQAKRAAQFKEDLYNLSKIELKQCSSAVIGSLVEVHYTLQNKTSWYFLLPVGGVATSYKNVQIQSLSIESPLGKSLLNKTLDDDLSFRKEDLEMLQVF